MVAWRETQSLAVVSLLKTTHHPFMVMGCHGYPGKACTIDGTPTTHAQRDTIGSASDFARPGALFSGI